MQSSGADTDAATLRTAPIVAAAKLLADRGVYGLVWFDAGLLVTARYGRLVEFVEIGDPVTDGVLPLIGLEDDIRALRRTPGSVIDLPAVTIIATPDAAPRLNLTVLWAAAEEAFLLVVSRAVTRSSLEVELSRQVRARLMAEAVVQQKSRELERANRDLEEYAFIISHDLKAPLRAIKYLTEDLETALGPSRDEAVQEGLSRLREQSKRMSGMLSALHEYSSIGRKDEAIETIDTHELVKSIVRSIPRPESMRVELFGQWPIIATLSAPLDMVLRNLIGNAIAHHDRDEGLIRIGATEAGEKIEFSVGDDGPGIAVEYQEAVFLPFRKLEPNGKSAGHGMGLSFVKRTIESVGGRLELQSDPAKGRGADFRVIWPRAIRS